MVFGTIEFLVGVTALLIAIYYYLIATYNFWHSRGVPGPKPVLLFGTIKEIFFNRLSVGCYLRKVYEQYPDEPMIGIFTRREPVLVLNDMELIKTILIKDFNSFSDRGLKFYEKHEPLTAHLFNLEPRRWRILRTKLSPAYTSSKLRGMFYLLLQCADQLDQYLEEVDGESIDIRDIAAKFATDVIGVCAFGIEPSALRDKNSIFRQMAKRKSSLNLKDIIKFKLRSFVPPIYRLAGSWLIDWDLQNFFINLSHDTMAYRDKNNIIRNDFIDQLRELKKGGNMTEDIELTDSLLAAQLLVFFSAGFETASSTISCCLLELAMNHNVQNKLRRVIQDELERTNGKITYDGIKNMEYLDKVVKETLRKYPPVTSIMRKSTAPYTFPGTKISIPTGTKVWIPLFAIQRDPKYFPDPEVFNPDRFTEEAVKSRPQMSFLAFGDGPRNCIGARFGTMQTKVGLVKILQRFTINICEKTDKSYEINPSGFLLTPKNGVFVKIMKLSSIQSYSEMEDNVP